MTRRSITGELVAVLAVGGSCILVGIGIAHVAAEPLPACTTESTSVCSGEPVDHRTDGGLKDSVAPCPTEDSIACLWYADDQGNGRGQSYIVTPGGLLIPVTEDGAS